MATKKERASDKEENQDDIKKSASGDVINPANEREEEITTKPKEVDRNDPKQVQAAMQEQSIDNVEDLRPESTVTVAPGAPKSVEIKKTGDSTKTVRVLEDHTTKIGGNVYRLKKGEQVKLPGSVAGLLAYSKKVAIL